MISFDIYLKGVSDNINDMLNSRKELDVKQFKQCIKIYSNLIRIKDSIFFEQDKMFLKLLKKFLNKSYCNFYHLSSYWLYTEYLLCSKEDNTEIVNKYKRYDDLLTSIIKILNELINKKDYTLIEYELDFKYFLSNVPLYNKIFIDFVIKFNNIYLEQKGEELNENLKQDKKLEWDLPKVIPYLENMQHIYFNIINERNLLEIKDKEQMKKKLLENFLEMTRNKENINVRAVKYVFENLYKHDETAINDFAFDGLEYIKKKLKDKMEIEGNENFNDEEISEDEIKQRLFFYFSLFKIGKRNIDHISKLPEVYSILPEKIKIFLINNHFLLRILEKLNLYKDDGKKVDDAPNRLRIAENLIENCNDKSEFIVISIINIIYGNKNYKFETQIKDGKLYRNIRTYYIQYQPNLIKGVVEISNKIPINEFFSSFIVDKIIKFNKEKPENVEEIFNKMNSDENFSANNISSIYSYHDNIKNKLIFYILYYFKNIKNDEPNSIQVKDLMIKYLIKKSEFKSEIMNIFQQIAKDNNINIIENMKIYDNFKEAINTPNKELTDDDKALIAELDKGLINFMNEKILVENNNKLLEDYYKNLTPEKKEQFKKQILKNISPKAKNKLDLIVFPDL